MQDTVPTRSVVRERECVQAVRVHPESLYLTREVSIALAEDSSKAIWLIAPEAKRAMCSPHGLPFDPHVAAYWLSFQFVIPTTDTAEPCILHSFDTKSQ